MIKLLQKLYTTFHQTVSHFVNALSIIIILNILLSGILWIHDRIKNDSHRELYSDAKYTTVYRDMNSVSIKQLLVETWSRPFHYAPFIQFKERPFKGQYISRPCKSI